MARGEIAANNFIFGFASSVSNVLILILFLSSSYVVF